jgi:hypothetical protein
VYYTTKTLPQLIRYCLDINCNINDGGISPKNICQACLDKIQIVFEFKYKSTESDKYLKQIIKHSETQQGAEEQDITPYSPALNHHFLDDESSLLQPLDEKNDENDDDDDSSNEYSANGVQHYKKGTRHGDFTCNLCAKTFKYVKPYKNHMKSHKSAVKQPSYYLKKKMQLHNANNTPGTSKKVATKSTKYKNVESQAEYDSLSPYNSPAPFEEESVLQNCRESSPDFDLGELLLNSSKHLFSDETDVGNGRTKNQLKRSSLNDQVSVSKRPKRILPAETNKNNLLITPDIISPDFSTSSTETKTRGRPRGKLIEALKSVYKQKKPGPLSKTRPRAEKKEEWMAEFSEVDINKMLKSRKRNRDYGKTVNFF